MGRPEWQEPVEWVDARLAIHAARKRQGELQFDEGVVAALRMSASIDCEAVQNAREAARMALEAMERR